MKGISSSACHPRRSREEGGSRQIRLHVTLLVLPLRLAAVLALEEGLAVLVELQLRDDALRRTDADLHGLAVRLVARHPLDVNNPLLAVDRGDLALAVVVVATGDLHLVILADR